MASIRKLRVMLTLSASVLFLLILLCYNYAPLSQKSSSENLTPLALKAQLPAFPDKMAKRVSVPTQ